MSYLSSHASPVKVVWVQSLLPHLFLAAPQIDFMGQVEKVTLLQKITAFLA